MRMQICGSTMGLKNQNLRELDQGMCIFTLFIMETFKRTGK